MRARILIITLAVFMPLVIAAAPALAGLGLVETSTKAKGETNPTTVTWTSSFEDLDYTLGSDAVVPICWSVDTGAASFDGFALKRFTPRSRRDPANGHLLSTSAVQNCVAFQDLTDGLDATVTFEELHLDKKRRVEIGNVHLKLYLMVDTDGDGQPDTRAGYGVNVHVEDPR